MSPRRLHELDARQRRRATMAAVARGIGITALLVAVYYLVPVTGADDTTAFVKLGVGLAIFLGVLGWQLRRVTTADLPELRMIEALATAIPFFIITVAAVYPRAGVVPGVLPAIAN